MHLTNGKIDGGAGGKFHGNNWVGKEMHTSDPRAQQGNLFGQYGWSVGKSKTEREEEENKKKLKTELNEYNSMIINGQRENAEWQAYEVYEAARKLDHKSKEYKEALKAIGWDDDDVKEAEEAGKREEAMEAEQFKKNEAAWERNMAANKKNFEKKEGKKEAASKGDSEEISTTGKQIINKLEQYSVERRDVKKHDTPLNDTEIIDRVGGGDMTKGSCASSAFCYVGNKAGFDVLDFRGGYSSTFFAHTGTIAQIADLPGVESYIETAGNDFKAIKSLLPNVKEGKEYILGTGKHCAVIRKRGGVVEWLELQSPKWNGWRNLNNRVLKDRFGCQKSHTVYGMKMEHKNILIDVDSLGKSKDFEKILGYINTPKEKQMKGEEGSVK